MARPNRQTQRRAEILDAAIGLIERHDLATLRVTDVAAELGLTANAVRYYFKDMHHLLSELACAPMSAFTTTASPSWNAPRMLANSWP